MASKVGTLIKEARTQAGLTQEALAKKVKGVSANDISLAERGEKELTQTALKDIAKATGVTQKSLLDAAKAGTTKKTTSKTGTARADSTKKTTSKTGTSKTGSTKKTTSKTGTSKAGSTKKATSSSGDSFKVSAQEKKLIQAYREADDKVQAAVKMLLLGAEGLTSGSGLGSLGSSGAGDLFGSGDLLGSLLGSVRNLLG